MKIKLMLALILALCPMGALAQMNSLMKEEFQDAEKHGVRVVERVSEIRGALHDDKVRVLCLQTFGETLPADTRDELLTWVRSGRTVWFYDSRMAPDFGMRSYVLDPEQFRHKPEKGVLGASKHEGFATVAVSYGSHAVQTGVGQVTVFLPEVKDAEDNLSYGAIEVAGDTVPLLQFALDSPALMALRRDGRGLIVFKSLLWNEPLSGDRFQMNLLDYSAGFQVPGMAGQGKVGNPPGPEAEYITGSPAEPLEVGAPVEAAPTLPLASSSAVKHGKPAGKGDEEAVGTWNLDLKDGTTVQGELETKILEFETGTASLKLKPEEVVSIEFGSSVKLDKVTVSSGKTRSGIFLSSPLKLRTERGVEEFDKDDLQMLRHAEAANVDIPKEK